MAETEKKTVLSRVGATFANLGWWEHYVQIGEEFLAKAEEIGEEVAAKVREHQEQIGVILTRLEKGEISAVGAKRAVGRYRNAIRVEFEGAAEELRWEHYEKFWDATGDVLQIIGLVGTFMKLF